MEGIDSQRGHVSDTRHTSMKTHVADVYFNLAIVVKYMSNKSHKNSNNNYFADTIFIVIAPRNRERVWDRSDSYYHNMSD